MDIAGAELVDLAVPPETEPAEIDIALDLDEVVDEVPAQREPKPWLTYEQRQAAKKALRDELRPSRSNQRITRQQAEIHKLRADLERANRTIDTLIDGHRAAIAKLRDEVAALGAQ